MAPLCVKTRPTVRFWAGAGGTVGGEPAATPDGFIAGHLGVGAPRLEEAGLVGCHNGLGAVA